MTEKEANFVYSAKKLIFSNATTDQATRAAILRKETALHFYGCVDMKEDATFTCNLLRQNLESYSKVVDDSTGVNNYVTQIVDIMPNNLSGHQNNWRSSMTSSRILGLIHPLPCCSDAETQKDRINCKNTKITPEALKNLHQALASYKESESEQKRKIPQSNSRSEHLSQPSNAPTQFSQRNLANQNRHNNQRFYAPTTQSQASFFNRPNGPAPEKIVPHFKPKQTGFQPKNVFNAKPPTQEKVPEKPGMFKTAAQELRIQNIKKFGRDDSGLGGGGKKNLGLSRKPAGVNAPYRKPTVPNDDVDEVQQNPALGELGEDERLRNIDPKMIETILNEIVYNGPEITWDDIAGLEYAKNTIQEVVIWPMLRPDIFTGLRRPPRGILLFGPPGTGKTLIGKCIANQSGATFFSISASSLTSKWVGEGEKMVRALFAVARVKQPSVVFIDEIDSILTQRSDTEHESSRRMKTEFLVQLDGVGTGDEDRILIVGATNRPQELDEAARRRLVKRLYVPLPDAKARAQMVNNLMSRENHELSSADVERIAEMTDGYSGADMKHVCQEASLGPIRSIPPMNIRNIQSSEVRAVNMGDFTAALTRVRSTVSQQDLHHYMAWDQQFGSGSA